MNIREMLLYYNEFARILSASVLILFCISSYFLVKKSKKTHIYYTIIFTLLVSCTILIWRAPFIFYSAELNPDESQTLASARILRDDPIPWRSVDTTTSGPLNSYIYMWTYGLGEHPTYLSKRITSVILCIITVLCLQLTASIILGLYRSYISTLTVVLFFTFSSGSDFVHASTEYLPGCMLAIASTIVAFGYKNGVKSLHGILVGFILGLIPFAKLQASLLALSLGLILVVVILNQKGWHSKELYLTIAAAITPAIFFVSITAISGSFNDMVMRYFAQGVLYKGDQWKLSLLERFQRISRCSEEWLLILGGTVSLFICSIAVRLKVKNIFNPPQLIVAFTWFIIGVYSIVKSGFIFPHYLTLLITPLSILCFVALSDLDKISPNCNLGLLALMPLSLTSAEFIRADEHKVVSEYILKRPILQDDLSRYLASELKEGDSLAIWGWTPKYFIESNARSATRDLVSYYLLIEGPYKNKYRVAYTEDIKRNSPKFFIDTATDLSDDPSFPPHDKRRYTCHAPLAEFINSKYDKIGEYIPQGYKVPIYVFRIKN